MGSRFPHAPGVAGHVIAAGTRRAESLMSERKAPGPGVATRAMIEQLYDGAAELYDRTGPGIFARFGARLVEHMPLAQGMKVLDVATGKGAVLLPAARLVGPAGHVTGVDLSGRILGEAERAVRGAGLGNVDLRRMDAERLDFPDGSFDAVTCALSLFMVPDIDAALREMRRVCRPGGSVGVSFFDRTPPAFDPGWPILLRQFLDYGGGVRMPQPVVHPPEGVAAMLTGAGLRDAAAQSEKYDIAYDTLEDWWGFQLTVGTRLTILSMDEQRRAAFKQEYLGKLRPMLKPDGFHVWVAVVYAVARR